MTKISPACNIFQIPLSKLARMKNIARSSLVTLPLFVQDQAKYKACLEQIGRLNGIIVCPSPPPSISGHQKRSMRRGKTRIKKASTKRKKKGGEEGSTPCEQRKAKQQHSLTELGAASTEMPSATSSDFITENWCVTHSDDPMATAFPHHLQRWNHSEDSTLACIRRTTDSATHAVNLSRPHTSPSIFTGVSSDHYHRSRGDVDTPRDAGCSGLVLRTRGWPGGSEWGRGRVVPTIKRLPSLPNIEKTTGT